MIKQIEITIKEFDVKDDVELKPSGKTIELKKRVVTFSESVESDMLLYKKFMLEEMLEQINKELL